MRVLGIDPGSQVTGYGVVESVPGRGGRPRHVAHGTVRPPRTSLAAKLAFLHRELSEIAELYACDRAVVEQTFVSASPRSALVLSEARGVVLAVLGAANLAVDEVAPRAVKKAVAGSGAASKAQVQQMVVRLLELERTPPSDAADALAVALYRVHAGRLGDLAVGATRRGPRRRSSGLRALGSRPR